MEKMTKLNLSYIDPIITVELDLTLVDGIVFLNKISQDLDLPYLHIIAGTQATQKTSRVMFTGHKDWLESYLSHLKNSEHVQIKEPQIGFYINGFGLNSAAFEQTLMSKFKENKLSILKVIKEAQGILCTLRAEDKAPAVKFFDTLITA
jgi:hypothetical protein